MDWRKTGDWIRKHGRRPVALTIYYAVLWLLTWADAHLLFRFPSLAHAVVFAGALPVCYYWARYWKPRSLRLYRAVLSVSFLPLWQLCITLPLIFSWWDLSESITKLGTAISFLIGLGWTVWAVDLQTKRSKPPTDGRSWNPFHLVAWYFGKKNRKLRQSLLTFFVYSCAFMLVFTVLTQMTGCSIYEAPIGGGEEKQLKQVVKIQKVIRKKYVINPYSSILFNPPPIDDVKLQLLEETKHLYKIGQGQGTGAGFSAGTNRGKVRFIRLKYGGGDWEQDMDRGSDLNLLTEYGVRLGQKVSDRPEPMEIRRLKSFPARKSPPMVYMTGQESIQVSDAEIKILRAYLLDKHGMLFADNGGSSGWEGQFVGMMRRALPRVEPISVYLDHPIHRIPYTLPKLPYVAKHGRSDALGWVVDGRLVAYYHPGDIGDAWADGHAGIEHEIRESCYQLGVNIIFYAHAEYNKWLEATKDD
ncbi:hypothetical protein HAHE_31820 [Haloferula helveola]|uniref:DUF4159 domain-containing protein n=1 Tax=Haloferula helveola TaxID=490095 RepID=A0ABN6H9H7_9BACT|nr:hypothetical protein HAHE_31820 [Haloferula helveola]